MDESVVFSLERFINDIAQGKHVANSQGLKSFWDRLSCSFVEGDQKYISRLTKLSPFSEQYINIVKEYHESITKKTYSVDDEKTDDDLSQVNCPPPYSYGDSELIGEFLMSFGRILQGLAVKPPMTVLEYGPGSGQVALHLARMGCNVAVVDIEKKYLRLIQDQAAMLNCKIETYCGVFGDGFEDRKFDRILFFESFHHVLEHNKLLETLRDKVDDDGFIMLAGEPIYESASKALPVPMGIRHDCLSMYSILTQGWMELGFEEGYFCELALRTGWLPERHDFSYSARGKAYILRKIKDEIDFTNKFLIKTCKGDCGFFDAESNVRWINEHGFSPYQT